MVRNVVKKLAPTSVPGNKLIGFFIGKGKWEVESFVGKPPKHGGSRLIQSYEETNTHKKVGEDGVSGNSKAISKEKVCYNNEAIPLVACVTEIREAGKVKEVVGEDMRVGLSALGKDCDFLCDPVGLHAFSMGFDKSDLHTPNPMDRGSEDEI
ncbi:hypothetical protein V6N11_060192 [Hibiscus sabdariffa]|uniref:Uncharacterized protein n=2 Tax=Hibiscus sabdariffa TaxID=183260 RepID=A0ABR1Z8P2_9ROSI